MNPMLIKGAVKAGKVVLQVGAFVIPLVAEYVTKKDTAKMLDAKITKAANEAVAKALNN
jgi:hypothetical protein